MVGLAASGSYVTHVLCQDVYSIAQVNKYKRLTIYAAVRSRALTARYDIN